MQEHARQTHLAELHVGLLIAVLFVERHRVAAMCCVHTDLMGTPGMQNRLEQGRARTETVDRLELGERGLAGRFYQRGDDNHFPGRRLQHPHYDRERH